MKTVKEIADHYKITKQTVYLWIADGLKFEVVKVVGRKPHKLIDPVNVIKYLANKAR